MADAPDSSNPTPTGTPLPPKPVLSTTQLPTPRVVLPAPPPGSAPSLRPTAAATPTVAMRPPIPSAAAAPTVATFIETNYNMVDSPKEKAPLVVLDFLAMAASLALAVLLWNDYLTLLTQPLFNR